MKRQSRPRERRGPFTTTLLRYPGAAGWTFAPIPKKHAPPVTRPWGRTPVEAVVDGVAWTRASGATGSGTPRCWRCPSGCAARRGTATG